MELDLDLEKARGERDKGMARVTEKNATWHARGLDMLKGLSGSGQAMTGEDMRAWLINRGLSQPGHPNAWGALIKAAVSAGLMTDTGATTRAKAKKSHACRVPVWRF